MKCPFETVYPYTKDGHISPPEHALMKEWIRLLTMMRECAAHGNDDDDDGEDDDDGIRRRVR
jgi:hypothetical protein